jgi:putative membrane protein insertion efficiency factor
MVQKMISLLWQLPRNTAVGLIRFYQHTLSPDHGPLRHLWTYGYCRHEPTCSQYAINQLRRRGFVIGSVLAVYRIFTCNPFAKPSDARLRTAAERQLRL